MAQVHNLDIGPKRSRAVHPGTLQYPLYGVQRGQLQRAARTDGMVVGVSDDGNPQLACYNDP